MISFGIKQTMPNFRGTRFTNAHETFYGAQHQEKQNTHSTIKTLRN